jgi:two-component system sensor histidine kinase QseC
MSTGGKNIKRALGEGRKHLGLWAWKTAGGAAGLLRRSAAAFSRAWGRFQYAPVSRKSLRLRLSVFFAMFLVSAWLLAALFTWLECRDYINEFFDTQELLFAERLAETDFKSNASILPGTEVRPYGLPEKDMERLEDDALGFAVFTSAGDIVMADAKNGRRIAFKSGKTGFSNERLSGGDGDSWRIVRLAAKDGRHLVAVGQELEYRHDLALGMLGPQLIPWLILLPVLLLGLIVLLGRELAPLRTMAKELQTRTPSDSSPLDLKQIPSEVLPVATALNGFFSKTNAMLNRERTFISDAAHELRTPLAGLKVQAQVAAQEGIDGKSRDEALAFLLQGTDRCSRLVEQLLALSRLEAMSETTSKAALSLDIVDWSGLLAELLKEYRPKADMKGLALNCESAPLMLSSPGYPALISMLLRNLLDNAITYAPRNGQVRILLESGGLTIENNAPQLPAAYASRLGERFFRPPGQEESGSGLGLSIVRRIVEIHRFGLSIELQEETHGSSEILFRVTLRLPALTPEN